jgi:hypothetical protein
MRAFWYRLLLSISNKVSADIYRLFIFQVNLSRWILSLVNRDRLSVELAASGQEGQLQELQLLASSVQLRERALRSGGFDEEDGETLTRLATALQLDHDWETETILMWFEALVIDREGENLGVRFRCSDDADSDDYGPWRSLSVS